MKICSRCIRAIERTQEELFAKREFGKCDLCNEGDIIIELFGIKLVAEAEGLLGNRRHSRNTKRETIDHIISQSILVNHINRHQS